MVELDTHSEKGALLAFSCANTEVDKALELYGGREAIQEFSLLPRENGFVHVSGWLGPARDLCRNEEINMLEELS